MIRIRLVLLSLALAMASVGNAQLRSQTGIFGAGQPGEVSVVRMEAKKLGLKNFQMESRQVDGRLAIDAFTSNLGSGVLAGRGLVDWSRPEDTQRMTIQVQNVEVMALLNAFKVKFGAQVNAIANGTIDAQWRGVRGATPRQTMSGSVKLQLGNGTISGASVLNELAQFTGIAQLQQFDFNHAVIEGTIRDGMLSFTRIELSGPAEQASGAGLMDLKTEEIRVQFKGAVSPAIAGTSTLPHVRILGNSAERLSGGNLVKVPLIVTMGGQVRNPQFTVAWQGSELMGN